MDSVLDKVKRNLKNGTLLTNGYKAVKNRLIKSVKYSNLFYALDADRLRTKQFIDSLASINSHHFAAGNYYLDDRCPLNKDSVVYSLGILTDVSFDRFLAERYQCTVQMYDPTPRSIEFMKQYESNALFAFHPWGVWIENTTLKFFEPKYGGSASVMEEGDGQYFEAECYTMMDLMKKNNHQQIDLFKADIEGAALPIVEQMLENNIYPKQIVVEFERPKEGKEAIDDFFERVSKINENLKNKGYEVFALPRKVAKYFSLELLYIQIN